MKLKTNLALLVMTFVATNLFAGPDLKGPIAGDLFRTAPTNKVDVPPTGPGQAVDTNQTAAGAPSESSSNQPVKVVVNLDDAVIPEGANSRASAQDALAKYGITVSASPKTDLHVLKNKDVYGGGVFSEIPPTTGVILQELQPGLKETERPDQIEFTLTFESPVESFGFERPALAAGMSGIWFPKWEVHVFSGDQEVKAFVEGNPEGIRYFDLKNFASDETDHAKRQQRVEKIQQLAKAHPDVLTCGGGNYAECRMDLNAPPASAGITRVKFTSNGFGQAAFNSVALVHIHFTRKIQK